jgi:hypothetical protein
MAKTHVMVLPMPCQGHVTPLMELSHRLVDHGFEVTFVNTEVDHALVVAALQASPGGAGRRHPPGVHPGRPYRRRGPQGPQQAHRRLLAPHAGSPGAAHRRHGGRREAQGEVACGRRQHGMVLRSRQAARYPGRVFLAGVHGMPRHHAQDPQLHRGWAHRR